MARKSRNKKSPKKNQIKAQSRKMLTQNIFKFFGTFLLIIILFGVLLSIYFISFNRSPEVTKVEATQFNQITEASTSAEKAPKSPVPVIKNDATNSAILPHNYGRSISVPIFYYHYIGYNANPADKARDNLSVSPEALDEQLDYLKKNGYSSISLDTLYAAMMGSSSISPKSIVLTFDDGYIDFFVNAYPILKKYSMHATVFIPTGLMDQGYYLNWDQIKEMDKSGLITFQSHTVHHPNLTILPKDEAIGEITTGKRVLEQQLGKPVNFFAYPYGASNPMLWQEVKNAGFVGAVGTWPGNSQNEGNLFNWPRYKIPGGIKVEDFAKFL